MVVAVKVLLARLKTPLASNCTAGLAALRD
jgi:hypothetical protein